VPLPARGDRQGETFCQSVSLRAVADERQKRSPLFFDRNQLIQGIVAVQRLDAGAQGVARGDGFGARAGAFGGLFSLALAADDGKLDGGDTGVESGNGRRVGRAVNLPGVAQTRQLVADDGDIGDGGKLFDALGERGLSSAAFFLGGTGGGFGGSMFTGPGSVRSRSSRRERSIRTTRSSGTTIASAMRCMSATSAKANSRGCDRSACRMRRTSHNGLSRSG
jgi:hypothetical protein